MSRVYHKLTATEMRVLDRREIEALLNASGLAAGAPGGGAAGLPARRGST